MKYAELTEFHPLSEDIVDVLVKKTRNKNRLFFRTQVAYFLGKMASNMRTLVNVPGRNKVPTNVYALNLGSSGMGKGYSTNILNDHFLNQFNKKFQFSTFSEKAEMSLADLTAKRDAAGVYNTKGGLDDTAEIRVRKEYDSSGPFVYAFDSGTVPALKQMRHKLLMADIGALSGEIDEIGRNIKANEDLFTALLELYDVGSIKQKLVKNSSDNVRVIEIDGKTPTNLLMFGTPASLLNGGAEEECLFQMLEAGYARRCIFGHADKDDMDINVTVEEMMALTYDVQSIQTCATISDRFGLLADINKYGQEFDMDNEAHTEMIAYQLRCNRMAYDLPEHETIRKAEIAHRYFKASKIAGVYAFVDETREVTRAQLLQAICLVEESGRAFQSILTRDASYVKVAKFIAGAKKNVNYVDLMENLSFFRGNKQAKAEMVDNAIAWGRDNHVIIDRKLIAGIEHFSGMALKPTDLNKLTLSTSIHKAYEYTSKSMSYEDLKIMCQTQGMEWVNHFLLGGSSGLGTRCDESIIQGFDVIVLDVDEGATVQLAQALLQDYTYFIYTTKRHTDDEHRFRVVMPISHQLKLDEASYKQFMSNIYEWLPFEVDTATKDRARKWSAHAGGQLYSNEGVLLDASMFVPGTTKSADHKKVLTDLGNLGMLEKWFAQRMQNGSRNNQLLKYALLLVDGGYSFEEVMERVSDFNSKLDNPLDEIEITTTIAKTVGKRVQVPMQA